jgi:hypothetical protein
MSSLSVRVTSFDCALMKFQQAVLWEIFSAFLAVKLNAVQMQGRAPRLGSIGTFSCDSKD